MYKLFIGYRKLGEFDSILSAKQFAANYGQSGVFSLIGENFGINSEKSGRRQPPTTIEDCESYL